MAQKEGLTAKQKKVLECYEARLCVVTPACADAGINRKTFYEWVKTCPEFAQAVEELQNVPLDFAENMLFTRMKDKSDASIIFYLKTKGKGRGYVERHEFEHSGEVKLNVFSDLTEAELDIRIARTQRGEAAPDLST